MNLSLAEVQETARSLVEAGALEPTPDGVHYWLTLEPGEQP